MIEEVTFGDVTLTDYYQFAGAERPNASVRVESQQIAGVDGIAVTESTRSEFSMAVHLLIDGPMPDRRDAMRQVLGLVDTKDEHPLSFSSDNGLYYMARLNGERPVVSRVTTDRLTLNFLVSSPSLYGEEQSVTIPSGGSLSFYVDGTDRTRPVIQTSSAVGQSNAEYKWGLRLDDGDFIAVKTGTDSARSVLIDCDRGYAMVNGSASMITLDSDWLELSAGMHELENHLGSGACTVTWVARWL